MNRRLMLDLALVGLVILAFFFPNALGLSGRAAPLPPPVYQGDTPAPLSPQAAPSTSFTYQGELRKNGSPHTGTCNLRFRLYSASNGTGQLGGTQTLNAVSVTDGLFTVPLDFANLFTGVERFLETAVQCSGDPGFTALTPLTAIKPVPYSISTSALRGNTVSDAAPATGDILAWNGSQWAPTAFQTRRKYYLTTTQVAGNAALTACAAGYHMASMTEIFDPSNLDYNTALGYTASDSGEGAPASISGWIRTGVPSFTNNVPGNANCSSWTSNSAAHNGSRLSIQPQWASASITVDPWDSVVAACNTSQRVWCVQD